MSLAWGWAVKGTLHTTSFALLDAQAPQASVGLALLAQGFPFGGLSAASTASRGPC